MDLELCTYIWCKFWTQNKRNRMFKHFLAGKMLLQTLSSW